MLSRRSILGALLVAPAIVRASSLMAMPIRVRPAIRDPGHPHPQFYPYPSTYPPPGSILHAVNPDGSIGMIMQTDHGFVPCDGQELSRAGYPYLYAALGLTYGGGDGQATFNVPDFRALPIQ